jgi:hypothetical protein
MHASQLEDAARKFVLLCTALLCMLAALACARTASFYCLSSKLISSLLPDGIAAVSTHNACHHRNYGERY